MIPLWLICYGGLSISRNKSLNRLLPTKGLPVYLPAPILFLARDSVPCVSHNNRIQNMFYLFLLITIFIAHYYDHSFPLRSKAPKEMKHSTSDAASRNLLEYA